MFAYLFVLVVILPLQFGHPVNASGCVNSPRNQSPLSSSPLALRLPLLSDGLPRAKVCLSKTNPQLVFLLALSYLLRATTNMNEF